MPIPAIARIASPIEITPVWGILPPAVVLSVFPEFPTELLFVLFPDESPSFVPSEISALWFLSGVSKFMSLSITSFRVPAYSLSI